MGPPSGPDVAQRGRGAPAAHTFCGSVRKDRERIVTAVSEQPREGPKAMSPVLFF